MPAHRLYTTMESPVGELLLSGDGRALSGLGMYSGGTRPRIPEGWRRDDVVFADALAQLDEYFAGTRTQFELALAPQGTPFQRRVWDLLLEIPFGTTTSYGALARTLGDPLLARAVGLANGRNPIGIVVPCHRVIGADGSLTGYGGGLPNKRWLLDHEARVRTPIEALPLFSGAALVSPRSR
jgi:methylated-DNA-[protein]-cysteine S-methyltransferase